MNTFAQALRREARVACSRRAQPPWFRIAKWPVARALTARFHDAAWLWPVAGVRLLPGPAGYLLYRWKTGGWNDLEAGRG